MILPCQLVVNHHTEILATSCIFQYSKTTETVFVTKLYSLYMSKPRYQIVLNLLTSYLLKFEKLLVAPFHCNALAISLVAI